MAEVRHAQPFSMAFCLDCHRNPAPNLRPLEQVYNLDWTNEPARQLESGTRFAQDRKINSSQNCYTCHR
jgi:hypothetical protein